MMSFREFIFNELAPANPDNPLTGEEEGSETHNRFSTRVQDEFDIDDEAMDAHDDSNTFVTLKAINYSDRWGFIAGGPVPVTVEKIVDAGQQSKYKVTFHLTQANKRKFYYPYKDGETPMRYTGNVSDKVEYMSYPELEDLKSQGYDSAMGMGMDPMGGGGGMGMDPMGGGMGGGGAPPMGGGGMI